MRHGRPISFRCICAPRLVAYNAARTAAMPAVERRPIEPLSPDEALRFIEAVSGHRIANLYPVTMALALRQGEALGLRRSDVDLDAGEIARSPADFAAPRRLQRAETEVGE